MMKLMRYGLLLAVAGCLFFAQPSRAEEGINGKLVSNSWLAKNLKNADLVILDASPAQAYAAQHIPGALSVNIYDLFTYGFVGSSATDIEKLFQSWGIGPGKRIVMYDAGGDFMATRLFYDLDYHGYPEKDLFILDGGMFKWKADGLPVTKDAPPVPARGSFKIGKQNDSVRVELPEFLTGSGDLAHHALLEGLEPNWHFGELHPFTKAGHIPNGIMTPKADFYNADKTFKSPAEIKKMLDYFGVRQNQQIYTYCGGGGAATVPFFAAKFILNYPTVKLYSESELGWLSDERDLPYWAFDAPYLMRETSWLQLWDSPMLRMFLGPRVSIVDVRPAAAFNEGHVPFAVNITPDVLKININHPEKLAEILGTNGVNPTIEATVISGGGITKDSALAFVALEKLGQVNVSLFIDPLDKWAQPGSALTKDATVVGPKKGPQDLSIPPMTFPQTARKGVIITDPNSTQGAYPKVFIASGKDVPAKVPEGKVVHVAYTDLLNADGTPKAAKDIWKVLFKAGVPRLAELICISDDPGEAAVNYFILKLMGYPDIKVLVN